MSAHNIPADQRASLASGTPGVAHLGSGVSGTYDPGPENKRFYTYASGSSGSLPAESGYPVGTQVFVGNVDGPSISWYVQAAGNWLSTSLS